MEFKKYHSIENSYRENFIDKWVTYNPTLLTEKFIITEKIHGANFSVMITSDSIEFGKRTSKLKVDENFFGYQDVVAKYKNEFELIQNFLIQNEYESVRLFGEIFGSNIQKGVFYGEEKRIKFFDGYINDEILSQKDFVDMIEWLNIEHMLVPVLAIVDSLEKALDFDIRFNSTLIDLEDNICEGIVIKPYEKVYEYESGGIFYLKKKNTEFSEKQKARKARVDFKPSDNYEAVVEIYKSHLNENRLESIFSKYGKIEEPSQIGDYIKYMLTDAKEDFMKDHMEEFMSLHDKERGKLFGITGKVVVPMLQKVM